MQFRFVLLFVAAAVYGQQYDILIRGGKLVDGTVWDGKDPKKYADSFAIRALAA